MRKLENWLDAYLEYTSKQESPEKLHFWCGLSMISAALKRQVWMDREYYKLYPNLYVLLVAESAQARKSIAMDIGVDLIREAVPDLYYISGSMTPEGLVKHMNRTKVGLNENGKRAVIIDSHILIHADELAELFGFDRQRASRLTILLTKIYGAQKEHTHTLATEGQSLLRNLYPSLLAATDPRNLKVLPEEAVAGLIGRLIFVTATDKRLPIAWPKRSDAEKGLYKVLVDDLCAISKLRGQVTVAPDAMEYFRLWYEEHCKGKAEDTRLDAFWARCHDTALKLVMLVSIVRGSDLIVTEKHMTLGLEYMEAQIPELSKITNWMGVSTYAQNRAKFIDTLRRQGGVGSRRTMMKIMTIPLEEVTVLESSLEAEDTIVVTIRGRNVVYKLSQEEMERGK